MISLTKGQCNSIILSNNLLNYYLLTKRLNLFLILYFHVLYEKGNKDWRRKAKFSCLECMMKKMMEMDVTWKGQFPKNKVKTNNERSCVRGGKEKRQLFQIGDTKRSSGEKSWKYSPSLSNHFPSSKAAPFRFARFQFISTQLLAGHRSLILWLHSGTQNFPLQFFLKIQVNPMNDLMATARNRQLQMPTHDTFAIRATSQWIGYQVRHKYNQVNANRWCCQ